MNDKEKEIIEQELHDAMSFAIAGMFIFPMITGYLAKACLGRIKDINSIPKSEKWKLTFIKWRFAQAIVISVFIFIWIVFIMTVSTYKK